MPYKDKEKLREYQRDWQRERRKDVEKRKGYLAAKKAWREKNRQSITDRRKSILAWLEGYKRDNPCSCGEDHPACLDFHHTDPSRKSFSISRGSIYSLESVKEEIKKCVIMCANCHRKLHWIEMGKA